jgi:hypothetical protein|tara:strand:+ start:1108 stop:1611 length:504 start_codon:yes stop_codon:yes gene_type:complete
MPKFASGKNAYGISDRSGQRYKLRDMKFEWNNLLVGRDEWEKKHPQLEPRRVAADSEALREARPDRTEKAVKVLLKKDAFQSGSSGDAVVTVAEPGHGRSSGDTVRFRGVVGFDGLTGSVISQDVGYTITKVDSDTYTFSAASGTATVGSVFGGGFPASAGPVTVEA